MKKLLLLMMIFLLSVILTAKPQTVRIGVCEWEPYTGFKMKNKGLFSAIAAEALKRGGYDSEFIFYPWAKAVEEAKTGNIEGVLGANFTEERANYFSYPDEIWTTMVVLFKQKKNLKSIKYTTISALAPATIGVLNGSPYADELGKVKGIKAESADTVEMNIVKMARGKIDYMIEDRDAVEYTLSTKLPDIKDEFDYLTPSYISDKIYLVFSKKTEGYEKLVKAFNKGLGEMKKDGTLKKIALEYGLKYKQ